MYWYILYIMHTFIVHSKPYLILIGFFYTPRRAKKINRNFIVLRHRFFIFVIFYTNPCRLSFFILFMQWIRLFHSCTIIIISHKLYVTGVTRNAVRPLYTVVHDCTRSSRPLYTIDTINENVSRDTAPMHEASKDEGDS